jgi:plasmid stabilization system protein ParE
MYQVVLLPRAKEDIREAAKWYSKRQKNLGKRYIDEVREKVYFIRQNPKSSNVRYDMIRTAVLNVFPFMIHYSIDEPRKTIIVAAVLHTSRDPEAWKSRVS